MVHRESLTFDEGDHSFSGYMMWETGDYGFNPEHPPLVKLLAAVPTLGKKLWTPPLQGRFFNGEAYDDGRDWKACQACSTGDKSPMHSSVGCLTERLGGSTIPFAAS